MTLRLQFKALRHPESAFRNPTSQETTTGPTNEKSEMKVKIKQVCKSQYFGNAQGCGCRQE